MTKQKEFSPKMYSSISLNTSKNTFLHLFSWTVIVSIAFSRTNIINRLNIEKLTSKTFD